MKQIQNKRGTIITAGIILAVFIFVAVAERIAPLLTEEEQTVFRRGRNAQAHTVPGHASRAQYGKATALEALGVRDGDTIGIYDLEFEYQS